MLRGCEVVLRSANRLCAIERIAFQGEARHGRLVNRNDLKRRPAAVDDREPGSPAHPLDNLGQRGPELFGIDGGRHGHVSSLVHLKLNISLAGGQPWDRLWPAGEVLPIFASICALAWSKARPRTSGRVGSIVP